MAPLFSPSLISEDVKSSMPQGFTIRPLEKNDYEKGFLTCLHDLTWTGDQTADEFGARYDEMDTNGAGPYYYIVIEHEGRIVGTGAVIIEKKFIWNRALVGHVEEICISKDHQAKGLGLKMIHALDSVSRNVGCTKSLLNCDPAKSGFYVKCGYSGSGLEMQHSFQQHNP
ncbi:hypothetical protein E4U55_002571 [Claviceps digitariae]|nr:hypothetical protein E4U55_002571 [Claviceps digitariae]